MFGRKKIEPRQTVILEGTEVLGTIHANGNILVEGILDGDLHCEAAVSIGPTGFVRGHVIGGSVSIAGRVEGTVLAHARLTMLSGGRLLGDARYGTLEVLRGGVIEGRSTPLGPTSSIPPAMPMLTATSVPALPASIEPSVPRAEPTPSAGVPLEVRSSDPPPAPSVPPPGPNGQRRTVMRMPPPPPSNNGAAVGSGAA